MTSPQPEGRPAGPGSALDRGREPRGGADAPRRAILIRHGETAWTLTGQQRGSQRAADRGGPPDGAAAGAAGRESGLRAGVDQPAGTGPRDVRAGGPRRVAEVDEDLSEWHYGDYEGLTSGEITARRPAWMLFRHGCPGERARRRWRRARTGSSRASAVEGEVALFGHGHFFRVLAARWLGLTPVAGARFLLDPATLSVLSHYRGIPALKLWNAPLAGMKGWTR